MSNSQEEKRSEPFRIAIIGGGIGGLFCALAIHHHHSTANLSDQTDGDSSSNGDAHKSKRTIQIDVYEQAPEYREIGAGVGLGINAARLLHRLGLGPGLVKVAGRRQGTWFTFRRFEDSGEVVSIPDADAEPGDVRQSPCARSDLLELFLAAVRERGAAELHTKKACAGVSVLDDADGGGKGEGKVEVRFRDGTATSADLVVGCDGVHSVVRDQFVTDANNKSVESGMIAYRGIVPIAALEKEWPFAHWSNIWVAKHRHFLSYTIADNTQLNIVAFVTKRLGGGRPINDAAEVEGNKYKNIRESWSSLCDRAEVVADFAGFDAPVQRVIGLMDERPGRWKINDHEPLGRWHFAGGRVVLVGDAAHAMLPHMGAGAGQSIEDGWILGRVLAEYLAGDPNSGSDSNRKGFESLESAMQFYQDIRLPRAQKVQAASRVGGNLYELQTEEMSRLSYEDSLPVLAESMRQRMKFVWSEDVDDSYNRMRDEQAA